MEESHLSIDYLADCWIEMTQQDDDCANEIRDRGFQLNLLAYDQPEIAWNIISRIIDYIDLDELTKVEYSKSHKLAANLGAGPLETLLSQNGETVLEKIESRALWDDRLVWVLGCVWKNSMSEVVWDRVKKVAKGLSH